MWCEREARREGAVLDSGRVRGRMRVSHVMMTTAGNSRQKVMETTDDGNA